MQKLRLGAVLVGVAALCIGAASSCSDTNRGQPLGTPAGGSGGAPGDALGGAGSGGEGGADAGADAGPEASGGPECTNCQAPAICLDGYCVEAEPEGCTPGQTGVCYGDSQIFTCDPSGTAFVPTACPGGQLCNPNAAGGPACAPSLCEPGATFCEGLAAVKACNEDGTAFLAAEPCPEGWYCTSGKCTDTCISDPKFGNYVGCAYWTVDLPNWPDPTIGPPNPEDLPHALVVANPNELDAELTFEAPPGVTLAFSDTIVPAGQSRVFEMPVINTDGSGVAHKGIRFESTRPILAHQFNPWKAIWSNDASLLLPESYLGSDYVIHSWPTDPRGLIEIPGLPNFGGPNVNGFFTVLGTEDGTEVVIQVTGRVAAGDKVNAMAPGTLQTITLNRGEILNIECEPETIFEGCDLTGSTVSANRPVAVWGGHESAGIGAPSNDPDADSCCLDHLEEQMLPENVLGTEYFAVKSKPRGSDPDLWRVVAVDDNVTLTTTPPVSGIDGQTLAKRGDWVEAFTEESFQISATGKVQVGQYLIGQGQTDQGTGDPSLMLAVPADRFRDFYVVTVPPGYDTNWLTIIRPAGATIATAGGPVPESAFSPFGDGTWELGYHEVNAGVLNIAGDEPFGLVGYGYNGAMSYGFIGGLD